MPTAERQKITKKISDALKAIDIVVAPNSITVQDYFSDRDR